MVEVKILIKDFAEHFTKLQSELDAKVEFFSKYTQTYISYIDCKQEYIDNDAIWLVLEPYISSWHISRLTTLFDDILKCTDILNRTFKFQIKILTKIAYIYNIL